MSSNIYFKDNNHRSFSWWLARVFSQLVLLLPSSISLKIGKKLLLKPVRRKQNSIPADISIEKVMTPDGEVALYKTGNGSVVLISHGWSGSASQMFKLMTKIADAGFQAVAYDQLGHGRSGGNEANLFLFIKTQRFIIKQLEENNRIKAVISHSMGTPASLNAPSGVYPLLLIAPVFKFVQTLYEKVEQSGVARRLLENVLRNLEEQHQMKFVGSDSVDFVRDYASSVHIVHDTKDPFTSVNESQKVADIFSHVSLTTTENLGHSRIISADETWNVFSEMVETSQVAT